MESKSKLLREIETALNNGTITRTDLEDILNNQKATSRTVTTADVPRTKASAVDVMFYITGIVLFAALVALVQELGAEQTALRIGFTAGIGLFFWAAALYLLQSTRQNDIRRGMTNALLLSGSFSLIVGGFLAANEIVLLDDFNLFAASATLALLGIFHCIFGLQIKRLLVTSIGLLLGVAAFPTLVFGLLEDSHPPMFVYWLITAVSGGLLAYATRVILKMNGSSPYARRLFDPLGVFIILMSFYGASYDHDTGLLWLAVLVLGIIALFYLSITKQDKFMLGTASFFLVLAIITVAFRYFSGYGAAMSLLFSAIGLLSTAVVASHINRRYIK